MLEMIFKTSAINQNIIKINNHKFANEVAKYMVHESHKSATSIKKAKRHDHPLIQLKLCFKGYFPFIHLLHSNLMVTTFQINS